MKGAKEYEENNNICHYSCGYSIHCGMHYGALCGIYEGTPGATDTLSMMKKQDEVSLSQDRDKYYYYPRSYRLFFAN